MVILNEHAVSLYLSAKIRRNFWEICCKKYRFCNKSEMVQILIILLQYRQKFKKLNVFF